MPTFWQPGRKSDKNYESKSRLQRIYEIAEVPNERSEEDDNDSREENIRGGINRSRLAGRLMLPGGIYDTHRRSPPRLNSPLSLHRGSASDSLEARRRASTGSINMWESQPCLKRDLATPMHTKQTWRYIGLLASVWVYVWSVFVSVQSLGGPYPERSSTHLSHPATVGAHRLSGQQQQRIFNL